MIKITSSSIETILHKTLPLLDSRILVSQNESVYCLWQSGLVFCISLCTNIFHNCVGSNPHLSSVWVQIPVELNGLFTGCSSFSPIYSFDQIWLPSGRNQLYPRLKPLWADQLSSLLCLCCQKVDFEMKYFGKVIYKTSGREDQPLTLAISLPSHMCIVPWIS